MTEAEKKELLSWIMCIDEPLCGAALIFPDGSEFATGTIISSPYENGVVMNRASWQTTTIDIHNIAAARIGEETRPCGETK